MKSDVKIDHWQFDDYDLFIDRVGKHLRFNVSTVSFDVYDKELLSKLDRITSLMLKGIRFELIKPLSDEINERIKNILKENKELIENVDK